MLSPRARHDQALVASENLLCLAAPVEPGNDVEDSQCTDFLRQSGISPKAQQVLSQAAAVGCESCVHPLPLGDRGRTSVHSVTDDRVVDRDQVRALTSKQLARPGHAHIVEFSDGRPQRTVLLFEVAGLSCRQRRELTIRSHAAEVCIQVVRTGEEDLDDGGGVDVRREQRGREDVVCGKAIL